MNQDPGEAYNKFVPEDRRLGKFVTGSCYQNAWTLFVGDDKNKFLCPLFLFMVCPLTGRFSKAWHLVTYEGHAEFRLTRDSDEAGQWLDGISSARRRSCKTFKEAYEYGEMHHSHITGDMPHPFVPHPNYNTTN